MPKRIRTRGEMELWVLEDGTRYLFCLFSSWGVCASLQPSPLLLRGRQRGKGGKKREEERMEEG